MQKLLLALAFLFASPAFAQVAGGSSLASGTLTNPTSTLTRPANTTAYASGQLIASSTTAGSVVVPSFALPNSAGGAIIPKLRLQTNVTTGWGSASIQIDEWSAAPTFSNGDGGTYTVATGSANYLGSFTCSLTQGGDGAYGECVPVSGQVIAPKLASGTAIYWSAQALGALTPISGQTVPVMQTNPGYYCILRLPDGYTLPGDTQTLSSRVFPAGGSPTTYVYGPVTIQAVPSYSPVVFS